jgi:hypothetical protein
MILPIGMPRQNTVKSSTQRLPPIWVTRKRPVSLPLALIVPNQLVATGAFEYAHIPIRAHVPNFLVQADQRDR